MIASFLASWPLFHDAYLAGWAIALLLSLLGVQLLTGVVLAMYYVPAPEFAYDSVRFIMDRLALGQIHDRSGRLVATCTQEVLVRAGAPG